MSDHGRSIRVGIAAILVAMVIRLGAGPLSAGRARQPDPPEKTEPNSLETGQDVRFSSSAEVFVPVFPGESAAPAMAPVARELPRLEILPALNDSAGASPPLEELLARPLRWDLRDGAPAVLILHTHATESYTKNGESYLESAAWRTLDEDHNMLSIGARVAALLEEAGIRVIQDRQLHDYPSYNGSYANSRAAARKLLEENPSIRLVLDLHRDAAEAPGGGQLRTVVETDRGASALLMLVMGSSFSGYEENLSLALQLTAQLEAATPGITRPIQLRRAAFNQDLSPGSLLVEVGTAGNSREEALLAAQALAEAIIALSAGCN